MYYHEKTSPCHATANEDLTKSTDGMNSPAAVNHDYL